MESLFVFYDHLLVGRLIKNPDATLGFTYDSSWVQSKQSFALSPQLELVSGKIFDNRITRSFFDNLLPEGKVRGILEKLTGKSLTDDFQFLRQFGVDCAGAFLITADEKFARANAEHDVEKIDLEELSTAYDENKNLMSYVVENHKGRFSLAGAQDKISLIYSSGELFIPTKGLATTHILKPPHLSKSVKDSVYNEYFCMNLARACGLEVPTVEILEGRVPFFVIERFDRFNSSDEIKRLHQIDFCQAQGFLAGEKYEEDGGPGLKQNFECIKKYSSDFTSDAQKYMDWISFNLLIGNNDCHSKNISFLLKKGKYKLAPFYDLLCTSFYTEYALDFAFKMGGNGHWGQWQKNNFLNEVSSWGLDKNSDLLLKSLNNMSENIGTHLDKQVHSFNEKFKGVKAGGRVKAEVAQRIESFRKRKILE